MSRMPPTSEIDAMPPQDLEAERSMLGSVILDVAALDDVAPILPPESLYRPAHQAIYRAMLALRDAGEGIDVVTLRARLAGAGELEHCGGVEYLAELSEVVPSPANARYYAGLVRDAAARRTVIRVGHDLTRAGSEPGTTLPEVLAEAERSLADATAGRDDDRPESIGDVLRRVFGGLGDAAAEKRPTMGLPTGFYELDDMLSGIHPGQLVIIAGRPGMGKTSLALRIAEHAATREDATVLLFSLEMGRDEIALRIACGRAGISDRDVRRRRATDADLQRLMVECADLVDARIRFDRAAHLSVGDLRARARSAQRHAPLGLVVVDYLQLVSAPGGNRQEEVAAVSRALKGLAVELSCPVVALSQLSRAVESRDDKRPRLADLRESGAIEADADVVLMLYREEYYNPNTKPGIAEVIVAKQRSGPTGTVELSFRVACARFENLSRAEATGEDRRYPT